MRSSAVSWVLLQCQALSPKYGCIYSSSRGTEQFPKLLASSGLFAVHSQVGVTKLCRELRKSGAWHPLRYRSQRGLYHIGPASHLRGGRMLLHQESEGRTSDLFFPGCFWFVGFFERVSLSQRYHVSRVVTRAPANWK